MLLHSAAQAWRSRARACSVVMLDVKLSRATSGLMPASVCAAASVLVMPACSGRKKSRFMLASSTCARAAAAAGYIRGAFEGL